MASRSRGGVAIFFAWETGAGFPLAQQADGVGQENEVGQKLSRLRMIEMVGKLVT